MNQKGISSIVIILIIVGVLVATGGGILVYYYYLIHRVTPPNTSTVDQELTKDKILNTEYNLGGDEKLQFKDGICYFKNRPCKGICEPLSCYPNDVSLPSDADDYTVRIVYDVPFGDLNGDNKEDAAVILKESFGGTGSFIYLSVLLNDNGKAVNTASLSLGDRVVVNSIKIDNQTIVLNLLTHKDTDPMCCPSLKKLVKYKLEGGNLVELSTGMADWKTYRNDEYGFEVKYPSEYEAGINENVPLDDLVFDLTFIHSNGYNFQIRKTDYKNIDDWYLNWRKGFKEGPQEYESGVSINPSIDYVENMEINGLPAKKVVIKGMPYVDTDIYFLKNHLHSFSYMGVAGRSGDINEKYGDILYYWERDDYKKEIEQLRQKDLFLFNQILSTFKFIK